MRALILFLRGAFTANGKGDDGKPPESGPELETLKAQFAELKAASDAKDAQIAKLGELKAASDAKDKQIAKLQAANDAASTQFEQLRADGETRDAQVTELAKQIDALKAQPAKPKLDLGPFQLPPGIDEEDVLWRVKGGLDVKMAVQAAIQQKNHDDAEAAKAKATSKQKQSAPAAKAAAPAK